ncbi:MAG: hypothetical protein KDE34_21315, partial [Anaerolineales bacterium]|nr:hypothetical protein [Anaerolineales bacterium]
AQSPAFCYCPRSAMNQLYLTPNLDSALAHAAGVIAGLRRDRPVAPARFLVPTNRAIRYVQGQLGDNLNLHVTPFLPLARAILSAAGSPADQLDDASRRHLLRHLLADLQEAGGLTSFSPVHEKPGFVAALIDWLGEMKSQGIRPDQVAAEAARTGLARDQQLAALFSRYQAFLQTNDVADDDGLLWLAADALAADNSLFANEAPLFILGFDQFNPTQRRLLAGLASRLPALTLYLLWDNSRPSGDLVLTRLAETRAELEEELGLQAAALPVSATSTKPALHHLRTSLLREPEGTPPAPAGFRAIAAASREDEVRWLLRDLKERLLAGADPSGIAVLAPQPSLYRRLLSTVGVEYGLSFPLPEPLKLNPAVAAFLNLIALAPDFPWRLTLETLRSPYIAQPWLNEAQLGLLEALTRERPVVAGREQWRFALRPLTLDEPDREDEDLGPRPLVARLEPDELAAIESGLLAFFDLVTPPDKATPRAFGQWLENNLLFPAEAGHSLALIDCAASEANTAERDQAALQLLLTQLRRLLAATDLTNGGNPISWENFRGYLTELIPEATGAPPALDNGLFFGALEEGRALQVDHLYILGLSEGEFPRPASPDIFYDPQERANHPLPLVRAQPAESATLWWQLLACPRAELTLLRPRFDESGALWVPSPYWDASLSLFPAFAPDELPLAPAPALERAASPTEVLNSAAATGATAVPARLTEPWAAAERALALERQRRSWAPPGPAEGILAAADITADLATRFGENHHWSASRLNRYGL